MWLNKIIIIGIILMNVGICAGWDLETPVADNETMEHGLNPICEGSTVDNPFTYLMWEKYMNDAITNPTYCSSHSHTIAYAYNICKYIYDGTNYIKDDNCCVLVEVDLELSYNSDYGMYMIPENWKEQRTNTFMIKKYFQELINSGGIECAEFNNSDEGNNPDVLKTEIDIDVGDGNTYEHEISVTLAEGEEQEFTDGDADVGYSGEGGKGKMGGSSGIYEGINLYGGTGGSDEMKGGFDNFFFMLIPLIFIIAVMRFAGRILK